MKGFTFKAIVLAATTVALVVAGPVQQSSASLNQVSPAIRSLERRNGMLYCGNFASGNGATANDLVGGIENGNIHTIAPHGCLRVACRDTTGVYACNDNFYALPVTGAEIAKHAINIVQRCCINSASGSKLYGHSMAGQQFTDAVGGNWNVIVGYANCNHAATQKPSDLGGWGVNESCQRYNTYIG